MPRRSRWRQVAARARRTAHSVLGVLERLAPGHDRLLPPPYLRFYYYRTLDPRAYGRAVTAARTELMTRGLRPEHRVLDIGSGIGNLAVGLLDYLRGSYDGVEIHPAAVKWCQAAITPRHPSYRFHRAAVSSRAYNPHGPIAASQYRFPFPAQSFDFIFLGSVFTHLDPDAVENYVHEIARLLAPGGVCVASYFLLNDETRAGVERGDSFMSFDVPHGSGLCRVHDRDLPESAVAIEEAFVRRVHADARLRVSDIRRGAWWSGKDDDQDLVTVIRDTQT